MPNICGCLLCMYWHQERLAAAERERDRLEISQAAESEQAAALQESKSALQNVSICSHFSYRCSSVSPRFIIVLEFVQSSTSGISDFDFISASENG